MGPLRRLWLLVVLSALCAASVAGCGFTGGAGGGGGGGTGTGTEEDCVRPTSTARRLTSDESGEVLAQAYEDHRPTAEERKLAAVFWAYMVVGAEQGELARPFVRSDVATELRALHERYGSFFETSCGPTGSSSWPLISSSSDFACDNSCIPSAETVQTGLGVVAEKVVSSVTRSTAFEGVTELVTRLSDAAQGVESGGQALTDALVGAIRQDEADGLLESVGRAIAGAGAVASAATLLGLGGSAVATVASVGAVVGGVLTAVDVAREVRDAGELVDECTDWKASNCGPEEPMQEGSLTASVLDSDANYTGGSGNTRDYDVGLDLVVVDGNGQSVPDVDDTMVELEDYDGGDGSFTWSDEVGCDPMRFDNAADAVSVVLTMDQSGSINDTDPSDIRVNAAGDFLDSLETPDEVFLISFATDNSCADHDVTGYGSFTTDYDSYLPVLRSFPGCEDGGTPLFDATIASVNKAAMDGSNDARAVVLFTDGDDTASTATLGQAISSARDSSVRIFTIGLSSNVNFGVLSQLAQRTDGAFFYAGQIDAAISAFRAMNMLITGSYDRYRCNTAVSVTSPEGFTTESITSAVRVHRDGETAIAPLYLQL